MVKIPVDPDTTRQIAQRSVQLVREYGVKRGWKSTEGIMPISDVGLVGLQPQAKYLLFQERGTKSFLMTSLEGKTIRMPDGRFVTVSGVGQPGWVTLPGGVKTWRQQKWRHPGLKPQEFMRGAIDQAINEMKPAIRQSIRNQLMGKSTGGRL